MELPCAPAATGAPRAPPPPAPPAHVRPPASEAMFVAANE
jgi:DNA-binding helix-hairpin-helix protein with protein kinase domain